MQKLIFGSRRWPLAGTELVRLQLASFWRQGYFQKLEENAKMGSSFSRVRQRQSLSGRGEVGGI